MPDRSFQSIDEILEFAIQREIEAALGYRRLAEMAEAPGLKELLLSLEEEEKHHRRLLEDITPAEMEKLAPTFVPDLRVTDDLAEEQVTADITLQELLIFAAQKEKKAVELYSRLAAMAAGSAQQRVFEFLAGQERDHKLKLEAEYESHILQEN